jgi:hypothetical protein
LRRANTPPGASAWHIIRGDLHNDRAGGSPAPLSRMTGTPSSEPVPVALFWLAGILSAFLNNTPTYLEFLKLVGTDPAA